MKRYLLFLITCMVTLCIRAQFRILSPDGKTTVKVSTERERRGRSKILKSKCMMMEVSLKGEGNRTEVVSRGEVGLVVKNKGRRFNFGRMEIVDAPVRTHQYEYDEVRDSALSSLTGAFNTMTLDTKQGIKLEVRAYNNGVAYRFLIESFIGRYKLLDVCDAFPQERPWAVLGTYENDYAMPWRTLENDKARKPKKDGGYRKEGTSVKVIPWRDALSTVSAGVSFDIFDKGSWQDVSQRHSIVVDCTYKYLYGGLGFSPSQSITDVHYGEYDKYPLGKVMGNVNAWYMSGRLGFTLPIQTGYYILTFSPYVAGTYMHMKLHDKIRAEYEDLARKDHFAVGAGFKFQYTIRERMLIGLGYEYQKFTNSIAPNAIHSFQLSIGCRF